MHPCCTSAWPSFSADGRYLAFYSTDPELVSCNYYYCHDIFVAKLQSVKLSTSPTFPYSSPAHRGFGWYRNTPVISLSNNEGAGIFYQWNSTSDAGWLPYSSTFSPPSQGVNTLYYYSTEDAGGTPDAKSKTFKVDTVKPSRWFMKGAPKSGSYLRGVVRFPVGASDNLSGMWFVKMYNGTVPRTGEGGVPPYTLHLDTNYMGPGPHKIGIRAFDKAGNWSDLAVRTYYVDNKRPKTIASFKARARQGGGTRLYFETQDRNSKYNLIRINIVDGKGRTVRKIRVGWIRPYRLAYEWFTASLPRGTYKYRVYATDQAGNTQSKVGENLLIVR